MERKGRPGQPLRKEEYLKKYSTYSLEEKLARVENMKPYGKYQYLKRMGVAEEDMPEDALQAKAERRKFFLSVKYQGPHKWINWEERIEQIVRMEIDEGKSQAEIAAALDLSPKTLFEYKRLHKALFKDAYSQRIEDAKTQHLGGYLRGRKKLAGLMGPAMDRLEKEITVGESAGVATRAALGVAKLVLEQDKGGGTAFLLDDDSKVLWERVRTEDPIVDAEIIETKELPPDTET